MLITRYCVPQTFLGTYKLLTDDFPIVQAFWWNILFNPWTHVFFITINSMILYFKHIIHIDDFPLNGHPPNTNKNHQMAKHCDKNNYIIQYSVTIKLICTNIIETPAAIEYYWLQALVLSIGGGNLLVYQCRNYYLSLRSASLIEGIYHLWGSWPQL